MLLKDFQPVNDALDNKHDYVIILIDMRKANPIFWKIFFAGLAFFILLLRADQLWCIRFPAFVEGTGKSFHHAGFRSVCR